MKFTVLAASVVLQVCLGGIYAWSVFVPPLKDIYGLTCSQTQTIFSSTIFCFTLCMIFAGRLLVRSHPTLMVVIGGCLFSVGYLTASFSVGSFVLVLLGIGLLSGAGIGFCYICPISVCVKHFPDKKGLVTGIAVAGFGGGAVLLVYLAETMFHRGMDVLTVFRTVGIAYGTLIIISGFFIRNPVGNGTAAKPPPHLSFAIFAHNKFLLLLLGMFAGTFSGLMLIGNLKPVLGGYGLSENAADLAIALFAVGNSSGRILWGIIYDKIKYRAVSLSLAILAVSVIGLAFMGHVTALALLFSLVCGACFGACFVLYVSETADIFGHDSIATVYPLIFMLGYGVGGSLGPVAAGLSIDLTGNSLAPMLIAAALLLLSATVLHAKLHKHQST